MANPTSWFARIDIQLRGNSKNAIDLRILDRYIIAKRGGYNEDAAGSIKKKKKGSKTDSKIVSRSL